MFITVSRGHDDSTLGTHKFDTLPEVGDTIVIQKKGVFRVLERGHVCSPKKNQGGMLIVEEIEGDHIPPSGRYEFCDILQ